jgi:hypothetical protein
MENKICKNCGNEFPARKKNRVFCSSACSEAWYLKEREDKRLSDYTIFQRDSFSCIYCGKSPIEHPGLELVVDHIIPISQGGNESIYNLITSCVRCNMVKGASLLEDSVYDRIINRNLIRNGFMSEPMRKFTERVFKGLRKKDTNEYIKKQKGR